MSQSQLFLARTRSAVSKLLEGIEEYRVAFRRGIQGATFVTGTSEIKEVDARYALWSEDNAEAIERSMSAQKLFHGERFARATLCGAVLELACKGIELYSTNVEVSSSVAQVVGDSKVGAKFALGREVKGVPLGLVIYAARNQHVHYNDERLGAVSRKVFDQMAEHDHIGRKSRELDLEHHKNESLANNVIFLLGWFDLEQYEVDMQNLLSRFDEKST